MSIRPIHRTVSVRVPPERAFELFTGHISKWWPAGKTIGNAPHVAIVLEPRGGGRWFERDADGTETEWGTVLAWEPPARLLLGWQIGAQFTFDPALLTEVELTFTPTEAGGTLVALEHRQLERFGADAALMAEKIGHGWPARLADFEGFVAAREPVSVA